MADKEYKFSSDNQPSPEQRKARGKGQRTLFLKAIKDVTGDDEEAFYKEVVKRAMNPEDPASATMLKEVFSRLYPNAKPTLPIVEFEFPKEASAVDRVSALEVAIAEGKIPADVAKIMVDIIKSSIEIEKITDLMERIANIEKMLEQG